MKSFKDSVLNFVCTTGCGANIYNATDDYGGKCPECGGELRTIKKVKKGNKKNEG